LKTPAITFSPLKRISSSKFHSSI